MNTCQEGMQHKCCGQLHQFGWRRFLNRKVYKKVLQTLFGWNTTLLHNRYKNWVRMWTRMCRLGTPNIHQIKSLKTKMCHNMYQLDMQYKLSPLPELQTCHRHTTSKTTSLLYLSTCRWHMQCN